MRKPQGKRKGWKRQRGMALLEFIMATFLTVAIIGGVIVAGRLVPLSINLAEATKKVDESEAARLRIDADFHGAVRDSIRIAHAGGGRVIAEYAPQAGSGIYMQAPPASTALPGCAPGGQGDALAFGEADTCFKTDGSAGLGGVVPGKRISMAGNGSSVFYSEGGTALVTAVAKVAGEGRISIKSTSFPAPSAGSVFQASGSPVSWECDPTAGTLTRITGYARTLQQRTDFSGAERKVFATGVDKCSFSLGSAGDWARTALLLSFEGSGTVAFSDHSPSGASAARIGTVSSDPAAAWAGGGGGRFSAAGMVLAQPSPGLDVQADDFTVDFRLRAGANPDGAIVASSENSGGMGPWVFMVGADGALRFYSSSNGTGWNVANGVSIGIPPAGEWSHVAAAREGTKLRLFLNGEPAAEIPVSGALTSGSGGTSVGAGIDGRLPFAGDLDEFRVLKGRAAWTGRFAPPARGYGRGSDAFMATARIRTDKGEVSFSVATEPRTGRN